VASLHQAIADVLPTRLEFYESWLNTSGLRHGSVSLPALAAVLSFLRREDGNYGEIVGRAGEYAATWTLPMLMRVPQFAVRVMPHQLRMRLALHLIRQLIGSTYGGSRAAVRIRKTVARVEIRGSLFCGTVREPHGMPLCGFYEAAIAQLLRQQGIPAETELAACRAAGGAGCFVDIKFHRRGSVLGHERPPTASMRDAEELGLQ
jgi:hypothetical protein